MLRQRITLVGEDREPSGVRVSGRIDVREIAGYVAAVRAKHIVGGTVEGVIEADRVQEGGQVVAIDTDVIGGPESRGT